MTTKIKEFTRANVRTLMDEVHEALAPIAEKHGLVLDRKGKTFYADKVPVMFQMLVRVEDSDGKVLDSKAQQFKASASLVGLKAEDLGKTFVIRGASYEVSGLNLRAHKFPVLATSTATGKTYKFPADTVARGITQGAR